MTESIIEHNDAAQEPIHKCQNSSDGGRASVHLRTQLGYFYELHESSKLHVILTTIQILIGMGTIGECWGHHRLNILLNYIG